MNRAFPTLDFNRLERELVTLASQPGTPKHDQMTVESYTPEIFFGVNGDLSVSYTLQFGRAVKIGKLVTVFVDLQFTPTYITASGAFGVTLPYPVENVMNVFGPATHTTTAVTFTNAAATAICAVAIINTSGAAIQDYGSNRIRTSWTTAQITSGVVRRIGFSLCYLTP